MPRGQPDYGMYATTQLIASISDMGELAARLGSPDTYDRRGNILFLEDFEDDILGWITETSGAGASVSCSAEHKLRGSCSMKLVAGSTLSRYAKALVRLSPVIASRFGMEIAVTLDTNMESWEAWNNCYTGIYRITAGIKFDRVLNKLYVLTTADTWYEVSIPFSPLFSPHLFYFSKLVFDISKLTYIRQINANYSYDFSAIPLSVIPDATPPSGESYVKLVSQAGFNATVYLDSCIMTYNEP